MNIRVTADPSIKKGKPNITNYSGNGQIVVNEADFEKLQKNLVKFMEKGFEAAIKEKPKTTWLGDDS